MDAGRKELTSSSVVTRIADGYHSTISQDEELTFRSNKQFSKEGSNENNENDNAGDWMPPMSSPTSDFHAGGGDETQIPQRDLRDDPILQLLTTLVPVELHHSGKRSEKEAQSPK